MAKVFKSFRELTDRRHRVIALGNFDGLHQGHQKILKETIKIARERGAEPLVFSFDPHPRHFFSGSDEPKLLLTTAEKFSGLIEFGFDEILMQNFDEEFSKINAEDFLQSILCEHLGAVVVIVGKDFHFGFKAKGSFQDLVEFSGFEAKIVDPEVMNQQKISSSWIRRLIEAGDVSSASACLSYTFFLQGRVVRGQGVGSKWLDTPTINVQADKKIWPKIGVYIGLVKDSKTESFFPAVINVGRRPTLSASDEVSVEANLLDFEDDFYGRSVSLFFLQRLRDEKKFAGMAELKQGIQNDIELARFYFRERGVVLDSDSDGTATLRQPRLSAKDLEVLGILKQICYL
jgi:riboflavin kinase/FMN adenylyltransferase